MKKILIMIPAYNEQEILEQNALKLHAFLEKNLKNYNWKIVLSDNHSSDSTPEIVEKLAKKHKKIKAVHQDKKPMSYSIKKVFLSEDADIYIHMDADLSTNIFHIPELIQGIEQGYDISIGSRTSLESETSRSFLRAFVSWTLISILKILFSTNIKDFQCGFKAINRKVRDKIIPKMQATGVGFMSTEMLLVSASKGYKIKELPVHWRDIRKSKSPIIKGITDAFKNIFKIKLNLIKGRY